MDVLQSVTEPEAGGIDGLRDGALPSCQELSRLLGTAQIEAAKVFECFRAGRKAAEVANG